MRSCLPIFAILVFVSTFAACLDNKAKASPELQEAQSLERVPDGGVEAGAQGAAGAQPAAEGQPDSLGGGQGAQGVAQAEETQQAPPTLQALIAQAQTFFDEGQEDLALRFLYEAELERGSQAELSQAYLELLYRHADLNAKPRAVKPGEDISSLRRLGGGSSLVYRWIKDQKTLAAFKPRQERTQSNYRAEIAAYRFCHLIHCGFDVPKNYHVYFDFQEFSALYARSDKNPKAEFKEITPSKSAEHPPRIEGTFKEWIPDFAKFPIEYRSLWLPWLNNEARETLQNTPASVLIERIDKRRKVKDKLTQELAKHIQDLTVYDLARQISNMLVFDFLINNWDRFSGLESFYGVNCQIVNGRFMSIDNGAAFPYTPHEKPLKQLKAIQRFSRATYQAILDLDKDKERVEQFLFPNPSDVERKRLVTLWKQRQLYLDYIDELIAEHGKDAVLFFE